MMTKAEAERRKKYIGELLAVWGGYNDISRTLAAYVRATSDIPEDVLKETCERLIKESENKPAPVVIIRMADAIMEERQRERMKNEMPKNPILFGDIIREYNQAKENGCTLTIYEFTMEYKRRKGAKDGTGDR